MIDEPNEALNGDCEPLGPLCDCEPPVSEPKGRDGEMEKVDPPKVNDGGFDWLGKRLCDPYWLALNA